MKQVIDPKNSSHASDEEEFIRAPFVIPPEYIKIVDQ